ALPLVHLALALLDRFGHELRQVEKTPPGLASDRGRLGLLHLPAGPAGGDDRPGRAGTEPDGDPEEPAHGYRFFLLLIFETPLRTPAPKLMSFTSGLEAAWPTRPVNLSARSTIDPADSRTMSTRSSSRFVFSSV